MSHTLDNRIVIVGAGAAGLSVAAQLVHAGCKNVSIIEPAEHHFYQPLWTLVGAGIVPREQSRRAMASLMPHGVHWIRDAAATFDPDANSVTTRNGSRIGYDYLVVAPGLQIDWHKIKGLPEALGKNGVCCNYSYDSVNATWDNIRRFRGGNMVFSFPSPPIKCAGAPQKVMYLAEDYLRRHGLRQKSNVIYYCATPTIFSAPKYAAALTEQVIKPRQIEVRFKHELAEIRAEAKEAVIRNLDTGETLVQPYDMLHAVPPMSAPDFIKQSPLANAAGWVDVSRETLQHVRHANVFSLGDASSLPTSKTAAAVRAQSPILVANLLDAMAGRPPSINYDGYTSCPLVTGYGKLILAEFDYDLSPRETFPFDQSKERLSMYLLKRHVLPVMYWDGLIKGYRWPRPGHA